MIERVETVIDEQRNERHDQISRRIEALLDSEVKMDAFVRKLAGKEVDKNFLEFGFPTNVQSGGNYNLKMGSQPTNAVL